MPQDHEPTGLPIKNLSVTQGAQVAPQSGGPPATGFVPAEAPLPGSQAPAVTQTPGTTIKFQFTANGKDYRAEVTKGGVWGYSIQMFRFKSGQWVPSSSRLANPILGAFIAHDALSMLSIAQEHASGPPETGAQKGPLELDEENVQGPI